MIYNITPSSANTGAYIVTEKSSGRSFEITPEHYLYTKITKLCQDCLTLSNTRNESSYKLTSEAEQRSLIFHRNPNSK